MAINKSKRYDEAIKVAKSKIKNDKDHVLYENDIIEIFPELKESEDEQMAKHIIDIVKCKGYDAAKDENFYAAEIAWLEKQGEQKPVIDMITPEESLGINSDTYNKIVDEYIYGEQKPEEIDNLHNYLYGEQKPAENSCKNSDDTTTEEKDMTEYKKGFECGKQRVLKYPEDFGLCKKPAWSEEDKTVLNNLIYALANDRIGNNRDEYVDWLKSLKERVQPKQEWSKEDERILTSIIDDTVQENQLSKSQIDWLKFLRPQNTWKPSDEQMKALNTCIMQGEISYVGQGTELQSLYNDLKKFTE